MPRNVLDLYVAFRLIMNIGKRKGPRSMIVALSHYKLDHIDVTEKIEMRSLAMRGAPWSAQEMADLIAYCEGDVLALLALLPPMLKDLTRLGVTIDEMLFLGRYSGPAVTRIHRTGIPIDTARKLAVEANQHTILQAVIDDAERRKHYGVFDGLHFRHAEFAKLIDRIGASAYWPRTKGGQLSTDDETLKDMARRHPRLKLLRECMRTRKLLNRFGLPIDSDGRSRPFLNPFGSLTGRNQPNSSVFGAAKWLRCLIQPPPGYGIAYVDWAAQEIAIAAALSGDERMIESYRSGDPHIGFAIDAGFVPSDATKKSHPVVRDLCKTLNFGLAYGQGIPGFAARTGVNEAHARYLVLGHRRAYPTFYKWRQRQVNRLALLETYRTKLGWRWQPDRRTDALTAMNFPMQSTGSDMMRLAAVAATESGIDICCPVHDAFLLIAPIERLDVDIERMCRIMEYAGEKLIGFKVRAECDEKIFRYPDHYIEDQESLEEWGVIERTLKGMGIKI
jgi:DNA polymerase I